MMCLSSFLLYSLVVSLFLLAYVEAEVCEKLVEAEVVYRQEEAPRDLSGVLPVVVERFNRALEGVVDVHVEWTGADLHGRVGEHIVQCKVTRLASAIPGGGGAEEAIIDEFGRSLIEQCFQVPFTILDTDECKLPRDHVMGHRCDDSAICINTIGSYECVCPRVDNMENPKGTADNNLWTTLAAQDRSPWEVSYNTTARSSCSSMPSTHGCCPERADKGDGATCRIAFRCPVDPCASKSNNDCAVSAACTRKQTPAIDPNYYCQCPAGLMGNGHQCRPGIDPQPQPKVMFDGVTPTEETVKNNYFCGCTEPVVDACSGFPPCKGKHEVCTITEGNIPKCACKPGFMRHDTYGCVDTSPPLLRLNRDPNGDRTLRLKQGDVYKEYAVEVQDENAEEYLRSLKIGYSQPLPQGCLTKTGEFHVNYTVATPWTDPPYVRITRNVVIEDIDECRADIAKLKATCPELVPKCDVAAGATCVNTNGSYTCKCPKYTMGDGFLSGLSFEKVGPPVGFQGGTGCLDTSKPVIQLAGPNPKVFRVCECGGISAIMGSKKRGDADLRDKQQRRYSDDIKELVRATAGAELCATYSMSNPKPSDCVNAYDETYRGRVDLSEKVSIGEPIQKTPLHWQVPYDLEDEAGNAAVTVYRDVIVEEVDLDVIESKIRREVQQANEAAVAVAVSRAVEEDRKKRGQTAVPSSPSKPCPKCARCDCSGKFDLSMCDAVCTARIESCAFDEQSVVIRLLLWLESLFAPSLAPSILMSVFVIFGFLCIRGAASLIFTSGVAHRPYVYEEERASRNAVTYYPGFNGTITTANDMPPRAPMPAGGGETLFSPRDISPAPPRPGGEAGRPAMNLADSIYESPSGIITPSKRGDGVLRRSPFSPQERY